MKSANHDILRYKDGEVERLSDTVVREDWLDLYVNGQPVLETPVTAGDVEAFVHGFLYMQGYIKPGERLELRNEFEKYYVTVDREIKTVTVRDMVDCASSKIDFGEEIDAVDTSRVLPVGELLRLAAGFQRLPSLYHETGGVHMAAFAREEIVHAADDISRRNAVDKVIGKAFLAGTPPADGILLTSGRISSDIVVRMTRVGIPFIVSKSAPTDKAIRLAAAYGITLCGFARGRRVNIYTHDDRVSFEAWPP